MSFVMLRPPRGGSAAYIRLLQQLERRTYPSQHDDASEFVFYASQQYEDTGIYIVSYADGTATGGKLALRPPQVLPFIAGVQEGMRVARILDGTYEAGSASGDLVPVIHPDDDEQDTDEQ